MNAPQTTVFTVTINLQSALDAIVRATDTAQAEQQGAHALHNFLSLAHAQDAQAVYFAIEEKAKGTEDKSIKNRCSEAKAVFTAVEHGLTVEGMGYHEAVKAARAHLKEAGVLPNGKTRKSEEERLIDKRRRFMLQAIKDGVEPEQLAGAWEQEQARNQGVPEATINEAAQDVVDALISQGFDLKTVRKVLKAASVLLQKTEEAGESVGESVE